MKLKKNSEISQLTDKHIINNESDVNSHFKTEISKLNRNKFQ